MKKQVKPIVTVSIPFMVGMEQQAKIAEDLNKMMGKDYYILVFIAAVTEPRFQVFYEKDFNEVKYEELKEYIKKEMKER